MDKDEFVQGQATTAFIGDNYGESFTPRAVGSADMAVAAAAQHVVAMEAHHSQAASVNEELLDWVSMGRVTDTKSYEIDEAAHEVTLVPLSMGEYEISVGEETHHVVVSDMGESDLTAEVDGLAQRYHYFSEAPASLYLASSDRSVLLADSTRIPPEAEDAAGGGTIAAPMHGQLLSIDVEPGASVTKGQRIAVLEAMKMQHELTAPGDGTVVDIAAVAGKQIGAGDLIMVLELEE